MDPRSKLLPKNRAQTEASARRKKHNKCPWGCREDNGKCDEHGYCRHLVGWTIDGKVIDVRVMKQHGVATPIEELKPEGDAVQPKDRVVNMGHDFERVYRYPGHWPLGATALPEEPPVAPDVLSQDQADTAAQDAKIAALEEKIAQLTSLVERSQAAAVGGSGVASDDEFFDAPKPAKKPQAKKSKKPAKKAPPAPTVQTEPTAQSPAQAG